MRDRDELTRTYDASGQRLMHLQAAVDDFDVFARSLSIGPETMVMKFRPERPMHDRYAVAHDFLTPEAEAIADREVQRLREAEKEMNAARAALLHDRLRLGRRREDASRGSFRTPEPLG